MRTKEFFTIDLALIIAILGLLIAWLAYSKGEERYQDAKAADELRMTRDSTRFAAISQQTQKQLGVYNTIINTPRPDTGYNALYQQLNNLIPEDSLMVDPAFLQMITNHCTFLQYWAEKDRKGVTTGSKDDMLEQIKELIWSNKTLFGQLCIKYNYRKNLVNFENPYMY